MRQKIIDCAKKFDADLIGFAPASRFSRNDPIFKLYPDVQTVIGLGFRVLRGIYRGVEEGTTYYQYTTMGVENLEETVMPMAMLQVCSILEDAGFDALPQRRHQLIMAEEESTNPEVDYGDIYRGVRTEVQMDFTDAAVRCGLGERGASGALLTDDFGPFQRFCFVLTDAKLEETPLYKPHLCDGCGACMKACPGGALSEKGLDSWRCAVYYNGANASKNPFMPPDALAHFENRGAIMDGTAEINPQEAREILDNLYFYPPAKHSYKASICGRACDRACYIHLEERGVLRRSFKKPFRTGEDWKLEKETL